VLLLLAACSVVQRFVFEPPSVRLETIGVTNIGLSGGTLRLGLDVHNPNPYELRTIEFRTRLTVEQTPFGEVVHTEPVRLPANANSTVGLNLQFTWDGVGAAARGLLAEGAVAYGLEGQVLVKTPIDERWVGIGTEGRVAVSDLTR
jgi:LEA14-like dessication related protein